MLGASSTDFTCDSVMPRSRSRAFACEVRINYRDIDVVALGLPLNEDLETAGQRLFAEMLALSH